MLQHPERYTHDLHARLHSCGSDTQLQQIAKQLQVPEQTLAAIRDGGLRYGAAMRTLVPRGARIQLVGVMDDPNPLPQGSIGTVAEADDIGTIHVRWDCGRSIGIVPEQDHVVVFPATSTRQAG